MQFSIQEGVVGNYYTTV